MKYIVYQILEKVTVPYKYPHLLPYISLSLAWRPFTNPDGIFILELFSKFYVVPMQKDGTASAICVQVFCGWRWTSNKISNLTSALFLGRHIFRGHLRSSGADQNTSGWGVFITLRCKEGFRKWFRSLNIAFEVMNIILNDVFWLENR